MDTCFEMKVKSVELKADHTCFYVYKNADLIFKIERRELYDLLRFLLKKYEQLEESPQFLQYVEGDEKKEEYPTDGYSAPCRLGK